MGCNQPHQQSRRCPAIAHVERVFRLYQAADADAVDRPDIVLFLDPCPHRPQGIGGCQDIFAFEQSGNPAFADRQSR